MIAMLIAIIATLIKNEIVDFTFIITGLIIGSTIGVIIARKVSMTAMPQMVALFNGSGGGASAFVALAGTIV
jgi:NAD(P) transhydrogenase subunit beta